MTYTKIVHNVETGVIAEIELNAKEIAELEKSKQEHEKNLTEYALQAAAKKSLLEKLGITEDEARLLLG